MSSVLKNLIVLEIANNHMGDVKHGINIIDTYSKICNKFIDIVQLIDSGQKLVLSADSSVNDVVKVNAPTLDGGSATTFSCWLSIYEDVNS